MRTVVYVDVLLFINTIITYAVLMTAEKLFKRDTKLLRLIAAAFIGSLFSLLIFIGIKGFLFSMMIKAASSLLITRIAFPFVSKREYIRTTVVTIGVSVLYSGLFILFYQLFRPSNMMIINDIVYFEFNPLILLASTALIYSAITVFHKLFRERIKSTSVRLYFRIGSEEYFCIGKIDTGCNLTEPFSGAGVIIVDSSVMTINETTPKRVIPYSAVNSSSILFAVKADQVTIDNRQIEKEVYIAVSDMKNTQIQAIINSEIVR